MSVILRLWGLIKQDNEPYSGVCILQEKQEMRELHDKIEKGMAMDDGSRAKHNFKDIDYLYEEYDRCSRFFRITQDEFDEMEHMNTVRCFFTYYLKYDFDD